MAVGSNGVSVLLLAASLPALGWLIASRRRENRIGWIFLAAGVVFALVTFSGANADYGLVVEPGSLPLADITAWLSTMAWFPAYTLLILLLPSPFDALVAMIAAPLIPVAMGIAILRYRLYGIDRIVSRTVSWTITTGVIVAVFAGIVVGLQGVLAQVTGGNTVAVAGSTLVGAAIFQPLRRRVQRAVDGRFNRSRFDAERIGGAFDITWTSPGLDRPLPPPRTTRFGPPASGCGSDREVPRETSVTALGQLGCS